MNHGHFTDNVPIFEKNIHIKTVLLDYGEVLYQHNYVDKN